MGERLLSRVPKLRRPAHFFEPISFGRPPKGRGQQCVDARLVVEHKARASALVRTHFGKHASSSEHKTLIGDFKPREEAAIPGAPLVTLQKLLLREMRERA